MFDEESVKDRSATAALGPSPTRCAKLCDGGCAACEDAPNIGVGNSSAQTNDHLQLSVIFTLINDKDTEVGAFRQARVVTQNVLIGWMSPGAKGLMGFAVRTLRDAASRSAQMSASS